MQQTLKDKFSLSSKGLHTGLHLTVTFCPAPVHHGIKIQRIDLEGQPIIEALAENVIDTSRGTVVGTPEVRFRHRQLLDSGGRPRVSHPRRKFHLLRPRD